MIHRMQVNVGELFMAPQRITFAYQESRKAFSVWYWHKDTELNQHRIVGTGHAVEGEWEIVGTVIMPDGFHAFHLIRKAPAMAREGEQ